MKDTGGLGTNSKLQADIIVAACTPRQQWFQQMAVVEVSGTNDMQALNSQQAGRLLACAAYSWLPVALAAADMVPAMLSAEQTKGDKGPALTGALEAGAPFPGGAAWGVCVGGGGYARMAARLVPQLASSQQAVGKDRPVTGATGACAGWLRWCVHSWMHGG